MTQEVWRFTQPIDENTNTEQCADEQSMELIENFFGISKEYEKRDRAWEPNAEDEAAFKKAETDNSR